MPVWVCGNTRPAIRRAARLGNAWNPFGIGLHDYLICDFVADGVDDLLRQMRVMAEQIMPALTSSS